MILVTLVIGIFLKI